MSFRKTNISAQTYGNTVHTIMQYLDFSKCGSERLIKQEIERLVTENFISKEQAESVAPSVIACLFKTDIGRKLINAKSLVREFKFSILTEADHYIDDLVDEQILIQGVVDCAIIESDGIILIDFKTDRVNENSIDMISRGYISQVQAYANALSRIYQLPIKSAWLYFFSMNQFVPISV